jgi:hypothetical protein
MTGSSLGAELEPRLVGDIAGAFVVPRFQRGYRWGRDEVGRLLDDISASNGQPYYLQPIVVMRGPDERWALVDGQQRLTTVFLIFQYLRSNALPTARANYTLEYETRPGSQTYLEQLDEATSQANIDYFHMWEAYKTITSWFEDQTNPLQTAIDFYTYLSKSVRVIWYEAPPELDATELFTRLNVGRIPLTDAELVKALLLSRSHPQAGRAGRAHEIAAQWDSIERDLREPELWAFATGRADEVPTHIGLLLDSLAGGPQGRERPLFHTFETLRERIDRESAQAVWDDVVDRHSLLRGWYDDRNLFHKIGYLTASGTAFNDLVAAAEDHTKSSFQTALDDRIRDQLNLTEDAVRELNYESSAAKCEQVLLLMNVETVRQHRHSSERYSFREHARGSWSLEHIHAQNAEELTTAEQWTEWLQLHRRALLAVPTIDEDGRHQLVDRINNALANVTGTLFRSVEQDVVRTLSAVDPTFEDGVHSISNLALLDRGDNTALSNAVFAAKRLEVLRRDLEGSYIPACTRNVFLKYYTKAESQQIYYWGAADRADYFDELLRIITPYLKAATS